MALSFQEILDRTKGIAVNQYGGQLATLTNDGKLPVSVPAQALRVLSSDPTSPLDGEVWLRSDTNQLRWREGGITYQVTGTAV